MYWGWIVLLLLLLLLLLSLTHTHTHRGTERQTDRFLVGTAAPVLIDSLILGT